MIKSIDIKIWGRSFLLPIDYDCFEDDSITQAQIEAVNYFQANIDLIEKAKTEVVAFCESDVRADDRNDKKDNIFSYLKPAYIFVKQESPYPRIALMFNYRYDPEHGIALVLAKDGKISVGTQDCIL